MPIASSTPTPDPLLSTEGIAGFVVTLAANIYILFGSSMTNTQQTALAGAVTSVYIVAQFIHAAYVRGSRAKGGALASVLFNEPVAGSDSGDPAPVAPPVAPAPVAPPGFTLVPVPQPGANL